MTLRCLGVGRDRWARRERVAAGPAVPPYLRQRHFFRKFSIGSTANIDDQYTTNALNQYTAKENNAVRFLGTAATDANVALAGISSTAKKDRAWGSDLVVANTNAAVAGNATIYAAKPGGGGGGADLVRTETKSFFIPKGLQTFTYDDDGNLLSDGVWDYTYDAENRLASMQHRAEVIGAGMIATANARRLEFKYDYQGRRVRKTVYHQWNGTTYSATPLSDTKYFYVGWNLTAEFVWNPSTSTFDLNRSFTWGLDLTGSLTAAGGVGALLQIHDHTGTGKTLLPAYDGNGNVTALLNADTGALEAAYEYDPFGNPLRAEGTYAKDNPFRFSTKFTDNETGLVYYGLRYYSPSLGRFINRDPIDESGGLNLYAFVGNRVPNAFDLLGLDIVDGRGNYQADGGGGILFVSNTDPGSAPTVHNPSRAQRAAMDAASRLRAVIENLAARIESQGGFKDSRDTAVSKAKDVVSRFSLDPNATLSVARLSDGTLSVGTQSEHVLRDIEAVLDAAGLVIGRAPNSGGILRQPEYATSTITGRTHMVGTSPGFQGDPVFAGQVKDAALGFVIGDIMDGITILSPNSSGADRLIAAGSIIAGLGPLPNVGPAARAGRAAESGAARSGTGFLGHKGFELKNSPLQPVRNSPTTISGRDYTGHALDQMQNRGVMPSVVENAVQTGRVTPGNTPGTSVFFDAANQVRVVTDTASGRVITVIRGGGP